MSVADEQMRGVFLHILGRAANVALDQHGFELFLKSPKAAPRKVASGPAGADIGL